jgi:hypothetical protein
VVRRARRPPEVGPASVELVDTAVGTGLHPALPPRPADNRDSGKLGEAQRDAARPSTSLTRPLRGRTSGRPTSPSTGYAGRLSIDGSARADAARRAPRAGFAGPGRIRGHAAGLDLTPGRDARPVPGCGAEVGRRGQPHRLLRRSSRRRGGRLTTVRRGGGEPRVPGGGSAWRRCDGGSHLAGSRARRRGPAHA